MADLSHGDITQRVVVTDVQPPYAQAPAEFRYDCDDPFAVVVVFEVGDRDIIWRFARDLLDRGLSEHAGMGDVRVWPDGSRLIVALSSYDETVQLSFAANAVRRFLAATYRAVPRGRESVDVDGLIDQLLGGA